MNENRTLDGLRLTIVGCLLLLLCGCGSAFAVRNDTGKRAYIDTVYVDHPRSPAPQILEPGSTYSAPRCWNEIARVYLGPEPESVMERPISKLCKPKSCNCTVNVSQL